jgi:hypothetical protein
MCALLNAPCPDPHGFEVVLYNDAGSTARVKAMLKLLTTFLLALFTISTAMAEEEASPKPPKLFENDSAMQVTLSGPWRIIMRNKGSEERYPGTLTYLTESGEQRTIAVEYQTRGLTRRDKICEFPPLKIYFDKKTNKGTEFRGQSSLKLVSYCQTDKRFQQYNLLEYLAYRIYNLITPYSFRVRALDATYQDEKSRGWSVNRFSFLIEDVDDLADRLDLEEVSINELGPRELDPEQTANFALFQYLIGNLDWSATAGPGGDECCHNGKLIGKNADDRPVFVIPYDFDSAGLLDAHYAAPPPRLGIRSLRQRVYRGFCAHNDRVPAALRRVGDQRGAILGLFENLPGLTGRSKGQATRFIESFYSDLDSNEKIREEITDKCRG